MRWQQIGQATGRWRVVLVLLLGCVSWFAWAPNAPDIQVFNIWDKLNHASAFAALTLAALLSVQPTRKNIILSLLGLLCFGALIELVQLFLPTRSADWADLLADSLGMAAGGFMVIVISQLAKLRRKTF
jgi:VanZ family protein